MRLADAGWSSLVARRAHNPKVVGSNPAPATNIKLEVFTLRVFFYLEFRLPVSRPRMKYFQPILRNAKDTNDMVIEQAQGLCGATIVDR